MSGCLKAFLIALAVAVVLGGVACVALVVAVDDTADDVADQQESERDDLGEPECTTDDAGFMVAEIEVTNNSSERSNYTIEVAFEDADGNQVTTAPAVVSALEPEQSTTATAQTLMEPPGEFTCRIVEVDRFSDE